jgi:inner membrane protein YidH
VKSWEGFFDAKELTRPAGREHHLAKAGECAMGATVSPPTDYFVNERTLLSRVRTSITIMAFGFVVTRFGLLLRKLAGSSGPCGVPALISEGTGVLLVLAGSVVLVVVFVRFPKTREDLDAGRYCVHSGLEWTLMLLMVAVGVGVTNHLVISG